MHSRQLVFVYNADHGLFNTLSDIAHKILSPNTYSCNLCALTHGYFQARQSWVRFLERLPAQCEFLHRDEFRRMENAPDTALPAVFTRDADRLALLISAGEIEACGDLPELEALIERRLGTAAE